MKIFVIVFFLTFASVASKVRNFFNINSHKSGSHNLYKNSSKSDPRIIGGFEAPPHSLPHQAFLIFYSGNQGWYCGGSLISRNYVITSAGCAQWVDYVIVTLGAHRPLEYEETQVKFISTSRDITLHEHYDSEELINDIALIRLPSSVTLSHAIQPISLSTQNDDYVGISAITSGWGLTDGRGSNISDVLNYVEVTVMKNDDCQTFFGFLPFSNLCTSGKSGGICDGDVGGPLVADGTLIGVGSFGVPYCVDGFPSVFSRITSFLEWITRNTDVRIS